MKLLTHNLLSSHVRGVGTRGFPLRLQVLAYESVALVAQDRDAGPDSTSLNLSSPQATEVRINPVEFNPDFVARMIPKVEWAALVQAANTVRIPPLMTTRERVGLSGAPTPARAEWSLYAR